MKGCRFELILDRQSISDNMVTNYEYVSVSNKNIVKKPKFIKRLIIGIQNVILYYTMGEPPLISSSSILNFPICILDSNS
jgi:hypothetical protein